MSRFIFRCKVGAVSETMVRRVDSHADVTVVERTARMLLVETNARTAQQIAQEMPEMLVAAEATAGRIPDTHPKVEGTGA